MLTPTIYAFVDAQNALLETDETNNLASDIPTCEASTGTSTPADFASVALEWQWDYANATHSIYEQVMVTPIIADLDVDGLPEIIFTTYPNGSPYENAILRAIHGDGSGDVFVNGGYGLYGLSQVSVGHILLDSTYDSDPNADNIQNPEIIAVSYNETYLYAFDHQGNKIWTSDPMSHPYHSASAPTLADLDQDGSVEVIYRGYVFDNNGQFKWKLPNVTNRNIVADLDLDGVPELISGHAAYHGDGTLMWEYARGSGNLAVANFDSDPYPEIVLVSAGYVYLLDHNGVEIWNIQIPYDTGNGGPPVIADMNGDGTPEIGVAAQYKYTALVTDGATVNVLWQQAINDPSSGTGSSVFDFNGDGAAEVVFSDKVNLYIFSGLDGSILWTTPSPSPTGSEYPVVADVDADGNAELIVPSSNVYDSGPTGIQVYGDLVDKWVSTRQIWNQHSYHITNVNDDGTIPTIEANNWDIYNNYRQNVQLEGCATGQPDFTASYVRATYTATDWTISARIGNGGNMFAPAGVSVTFYDGDPNNGGTILGTTTTGVQLETGQYTDVSITLDISVTAGPVWVVADDLGGLVGQHNEVNEQNNVHASNVYNPENFAPVVDAGSDQSLDMAVSSTTTLAGNVSDTTLPLGAGTLSHTWSLQSGPATVTITDTSLLDTTVTFTAGGDYVFKLYATDGVASATDTMTVTVIGPPIPPEPPLPNQTLDIDGCMVNPTHASKVTGVVNVDLASGVDLTNASVFAWLGSDPDNYWTIVEAINMTGGTTVAQFDTTLLANDSYGIQIVGTNTTGEEVVCGVGVFVVGEYKPGRVVLSTVDFTVPVSGLPITIGRTYDSLERYNNSDFGYGWSLLIGSPRLEIDNSNNVTLTLPNGQRKTFYFAPQPYPFISTFAAPNYLSEPGEYGEFRSNGCGLIVNTPTGYSCFPGSSYSQSVSQFTYDDPYGREFKFSSTGELQSITDLNGNTLTFSPDGIVSSDGLDVDFVRDAQGRITSITSITDPNSAVYTYSYDVNGDLVGVDLPDTTAQTIQYSYYTQTGWEHLFEDGTDARGNTVITTTYTADGRLQSVTDGLTNTTTYSYDVAGHTTTVTNPDGINTVVTTYDDMGNMLTETNELGHTTTYVYDANYNVTSVANHLGETTSYSYDASGNRTSVTNANNDVVITASYNQYGGPTSLTDANGVSRTIAYNATGMPISASDAIGTFGAYAWDTKGNPQSVTDASGAVTDYAYDAYGNVITQTAPEVTIDGVPVRDTVSYTYDTMGRRLTTTNSEGTTTTNTYNAMGRVKAVITRDNLGATLNSVTYGYDGNGNRTTVTNIANDTTTYTYDVNNRVTRVDYPDGTQTETIYDFRGNVTSQTDMAGVKTCYDYDAAGQLEFVRQYCENPTVAEIITQYIYDDAGRRTHVIEGYGTTSATTTFSQYDAAGRLEFVKTAYNTADEATTTYNYDDAGQLLSMTDALGNVTSYEYDIRGRRAKTIYPDGTFTISQYDALGRVTSTFDTGGIRTDYVYNAVGNLLTTTRGANTNYAAETEYQYNQLGQRVKTIDPLDGMTWFYYDALGRVTTTRDPVDAYTVTAYNDLGQMETQTSAGTTQNGGAAVTQYSYDAMGRLVTVAYPDGTSTHTTYTNGRRTQTTDQEGNITHYEYDDAGRLISVVAAYGTAEQTTVATYSYDERGRQHQVFDANTNPTTYTYDALGRMVQVTNALNDTTTYSYDALGRRTSTTDALDVTTEYDYDNMGRLLNTILPHETDPNLDILLQSNSYNARGWQIGQTDANGLKTSYEYDNLGRLTGVVNPMNQATRYTYDVMGQVTSITDANQQVTSFDYTARGELWKKFWPDGEMEVFAYDPNGNLTHHTRGSITNTYQYNTMNQVEYEYLNHDETPGTYDDYFQYGYTPNGQLDSVYASNTTLITDYDYDPLGRPLGIDTNGDNIDDISYTYDDNGNRTQMTTPAGTTSYAYNALNQLTTVNAGGQATTFGYNDVGLLLSINRPNGVNTTYTYDPQRYFLDQLIHTDTSTSTVLGNYEYEYDAVGNRLSMSEFGNQTHTWTYDNAYRLTSELRNGDLTTYGYDEVGNRTRETGPDGVINYSYNVNDQLTQLVENGVTTSFTYDTRGNMVSINDGTDTTVYNYNARDQLIGVDVNTINVATYQYDHNGYRISQSDGVNTTNYLWDEFSAYGDVVLETDGLGNSISYTLANGQLISHTVNTNIDYFLTDAQGSTRLLTGTNGAVSATYDYNAFGELVSSTGTSDTNYLYTGQQYDPVTELYSLRARYYNPSLGRFMSRDANAYSYQNPVELNRYSYAMNNPVNYSDPSGHSALFEYDSLLASQQRQAGAIGGGAAGLSGSTFFYVAARLGACGDSLTDWAKNTNARAFIRESTIKGAVSGYMVTAMHQMHPNVVKAVGTAASLIKGAQLLNKDGKACYFGAVAAAIYGGRWGYAKGMDGGGARNPQLPPGGGTGGSGTGIVPVGGTDIVPVDQDNEITLPTATDGGSNPIIMPQGDTDDRGYIKLPPGSEFELRVQAIRQQYQLDTLVAPNGVKFAGKNVALSIHDIQGFGQGEIHAVSGKTWTEEQIPGYYGVSYVESDSRILTTLKPGDRGYSRDGGTDSEAKILEWYARNLSTNSRGTIALYTPKIPCKSCGGINYIHDNGVIGQLRDRLPNVTITVYYTYD